MRKLKAVTIFAAFVVLLACVFAAVTDARQQPPAAAQKPEQVPAAAEQQQAFLEALREVEAAQAAEAAAVARREAAQARAQSVLLRIYAKQKLDPDEYDAQLVEGRLVFERKKAAGSRQ